MALVWQVLHEDPQCPSRVVREKVTQRHVPIAVSVRPLNRLRAQWQLNRRKGRPRHAALSRLGGAGAALVQGTPPLSCVGVHRLAHGLEQQASFVPVVARLQQAIAAYKPAHPDDDFALLPHREQPLLHRFQALFFAPLLGIAPLTGFDTHEQPLQTLLGRGDHSSTLRQFLGQLERLDAAETLRAALVPDTGGQIPYVEGHMIAYWSRRSMHKGKITMLGRIMAGSHAVIAHNAAGQALFVAYYPPDLHLSQVIVAYCPRGALATGSTLCVIARAVNSVALAGACASQGLGLLCRLDDNEHAGLASFAATEGGTLADGTKVYSGEWHVPRPEAPRHFVMVEPAAGKPWVYWGPPQGRAELEATQWPRVYRARSERQEHSFKRMIAHGALNTNYGRKTLVGPDRHQQRVREQLAQSLEVAQKRVAKKAEALRLQQAKVAESQAKGHGKRLAQRQQTFVGLQKECKDVQHTQAKRMEQAAAIGPPRERADRDFRKQTIMTVRTLLLENALTSFMAVLLGHLQLQGSLECLLKILFERSGARMETDAHVLYGVNTTGLSVAYQRLLAAVVDGLGAMDLR